MHPTIAVPKAFGPFEVLETIGRGATATVYKARYTPTGKIAAIKVGHGFMDLEPGALARFRREFTTIQGLRHPNLVRALALGEGDGIAFVAMEYVAGQNLDQLVKLKESLSPAEAVPIFLQVADGLRYLHANQILHRDIKPSNILLDANHQAKLADFGLLKDLANENEITLSRQGLGTMEYGAPEQFEDAKHVGPRCDLYSLAATLYTALTGKFPFGNGGHLQVMQRKLLNQFVPLGLLVPTLDPAVDRLVNRCLDSSPAQRPDDCDELIAVLQDCETDPASVAVSAPEVDSPTTGPANGSERRATLRFAIDLTAALVPFHQKMRGRWEGTILDVSSEGIRLQTSRSVAVNSVLQVTLGKHATPELVLVRWVRPADGQSQIVGCSFVRPLPTQELEAICRAGVRQNMS